MKVRLLDHTIRLRIGQGELDTLHGEGRLVGATRFGAAPDAAWTYVLVCDPEATPLSVAFSNGRLTIGLSAAILDELVSTDRVGVEHQVPVGDAGVLRVTVEKDFKCLSPRTEDADAFPHPEAESGHAC